MICNKSLADEQEKNRNKNREKRRENYGKKTYPEA
jgi:hypothetical protein